MCKLILYGMEVSPPTRAVILTLKALNVPFEFKIVDLFANEQHTPEFRCINSEGTVPVIDDNGHIVTDSHAINCYLANKYGKDEGDSLYPRDPMKRSVVDQRLYYDMGVAFERILRATARPILQENNYEIPQYKIDNIASVYETVNNFLRHKPYVAGVHLTIADFSLITTIISMAVFLEIDTSKYPKLSTWMKNLEKLPYFKEANSKGAVEFSDYMKARNLKIVP
ncbi:glutathione S-transferase 1-1-like [Eurosta solidaginis]|uniref:glutathione S-transferase 1-1-like n=1 Tax=Eurosta solidaginis TaxID=178769 RepID=UPI00353106FA